MNYSVLYWATILAGFWMALNGQPTVSTFLSGFLLSWIILRYLHPFEDRPAVRFQLWSTVRLLVFVLADLMRSTWDVSREILRRNPRLDRAVLAIPLDPDTDNELATYALLIGLAPGNLPLHVAQDRSRIFVHSLLASPTREPELRANLKRLEGRVREAVI